MYVMIPSTLVEYILFGHHNPYLTLQFYDIVIILIILGVKQVNLPSLQ